MALKLETGYLKNFIAPDEYEAISAQVESAHELLTSGKGPGSDFLGWMTLPTDYDKEEFARIKKAAKKIQDSCDVFIVIGIGGSYLGARAAIEFMKSDKYNDLRKGTPAIYYAGNSLSSTHLHELREICEGKDVCINMISKSGTTTEPAIAFRIFRELLEEKYGKEGARERIFCTTDRAKGTLKHLADKEGYETFVVPDDVGGRFSVLTAVGLLPIAVAGIDIDALMEGARFAQNKYVDPDIMHNDCYLYAAIRNILYRKHKGIEVLVSYSPRFTLMNEWWKQLFGESEGKNGRGIYPSSCVFSTDLHSLGQFMQEGSRTMFETTVLFDKRSRDFVIGNDPENVDGLNFLEGKKMSWVNKMAFEATVLAHTEGGVPQIVLECPDFTEHTLGEIIYFFEKACAISGYLLAVNPFNQPGVENYKKKMFALLGKPGYEAEREVLEAQISKAQEELKSVDF